MAAFRAGGELSGMTGRLSIESHVDVVAVIDGIGECIDARAVSVERVDQLGRPTGDGQSRKFDGELAAES